MIRLALNPETTPLAVSDTLVFKPCEVKIDEAVESGFEAVNLDPSGSDPNAVHVRRLLNEKGLVAASGFFQAEFYDAAREALIIEKAAARADYAKILGQDCLFVSPWTEHTERLEIAGRVLPNERQVLGHEQFERMAALLERIAQSWKAEGITMCFHPHVGTYVEAMFEIEEILSLTDPELVRLGPDTGHLLYAGIEPIPFITKNLDRVFAIHIKDVDAAILSRVRSEGMDYRRACAAGIWTELGDGAVDFPGLFDLLRDHDWQGWVIVETDHTKLPTALASSRKSRQYLRDVIGI